MQVQIRHPLHKNQFWLLSVHQHAPNFPGEIVYCLLMTVFKLCKNQSGCNKCDNKFHISFERTNCTPSTTLKILPFHVTHLNSNFNKLNMCFESFFNEKLIGILKILIVTQKLYKICFLNGQSLDSAEGHVNLMKLNKT